MGELKNCRTCNRLFMYSFGPQVCQHCLKSDEEDFKKVKDYLNQFPGVTLQEVSKETGVSSNKIRRYLKEGRLEVSGNSSILLQCEKCGASIRSGSYCDECSRSMAQDMKSIAKTIEPKKQEPQKQESQHKPMVERRGLHYLNEDKK